MAPNISPQAFVPISSMRNRDQVLKRLLPKVFGIICEKGQCLEGLPGCAAKLEETTASLSSRGKTTH
jgi:hypothetical protein